MYSERARSRAGLIEDVRAPFYGRNQGLSSELLTMRRQDPTDYHPDIPEDDFRRKLEQYPCIRTRASHTESDRRKWQKLELFLKLDEMLSPLHESELPPIIDLQERFRLDDYTQRYILEDANFRLMGMNNSGQPVVYYHILMLADEQSLIDGTLLHVDFDRSGDPALSFRYPAIDSFLPWAMHLNSDCNLRWINGQFYDRGGLTNPYVFVSL